jgi:hypothetical protein
MASSLLRSFCFLALFYAFLGAAAADPDPPARVGRASLVEGDVAYLRDGAWTPLPLNLPITTGARLSAAPGARAELRVGSTAIRLGEATELEIARLDDDAIALRLLRGTIDARVRNAEVARELSVETPTLRATPLEPGRYRFEAGVGPDASAVSADIGSVRVEASGNAFVVRAGKRAEVARDGDIRLDEARADAFDDWARARDRRSDASRSARYVSPEMTGHESLDEHGDWREVPDYGTVWVPRVVPAGWAPYRTGRWAWIAPWGWTWIDEAPWGFAPFHYGRWAFVGGIWVWAPGRFVARPVYAPALVGWVGRPGWSVSVSIGTVPAVGWFPLAPREVFVPAYRCSNTYVRQVNVTHVTNVTQITNVTNVTNVNYANRRIDRAVTVVPAAAVTNGQPVARSHVPVRRAELDRHAPASPTPPVAAAAPPRPESSQARRDDDRGPQRRFEPVDRARDARHEERRPEARRQPPSDPAATPTTPKAAASAAPAQAAPSAPVAQPPRAVEVRPEPRPPTRHDAQRMDAPGAPQRSLETRAEPRPQVQRPEPPRAVAPPVPTPAAAQPQPRFEPRTVEVRPEPRRENPRELPRGEPPRAMAPPAPTPLPQAQPRPEPRREAPRTEPPRVAAPAPMPSPPQSRFEPRPSAPAPVVRAAPPPMATPAPPPQQQAPRGDGQRGQGREQRRGDGRGAG